MGRNLKEALQTIKNIVTALAGIAAWLFTACIHLPIFMVVVIWMVGVKYTNNGLYEAFLEGFFNLYMRTNKYKEKTNAALDQMVDMVNEYGKQPASQEDIKAYERKHGPIQ